MELSTCFNCKNKIEPHLKKCPNCENVIVSSVKDKIKIYLKKPVYWLLLFFLILFYFINITLFIDSLILSFLVIICYIDSKRKLQPHELNLFSLIFGWFFGSLYFLLFLACEFVFLFKPIFNYYNILAGVPCLLACMLLLPPVRRYFYSKTKINIYWLMRLFFVIALHIIYIMFASLAFR